MLFGAENHPGTEYISGTQDHIGLLVPGISRLDYNGKFWPNHIENTSVKETCEWLLGVLNLVPLQPRPEGYNPIFKKKLTTTLVKRLGESGKACYDAILKRDVKQLGESMKETFLCWSEMLPDTVPDWVMKEMKSSYFPKYSGAITSGSGGGYVVFPSETRVEGAIKKKVRF